ncbi:endonuclease/exonuclease/phosphatase family protein [Dyadobacter sp. UP-52]|uniref:Endonuclease/exonuclease/phosphatase family protein n=1 Tax=Dyadobacter subterraneus TaxID=2773304 RepID=A0ABR9W7N0_9BACT|nr:endonuclease/exonuclease/phosphatase family protein [Dyadobacter subterraneus]
MKGLKGFFWFLFKCFAVYSLLVYGLTFWVPSSHWLPGFLMMSFPVTVLINFGFLVFWLLVDSKKALAPLFLIFLSGIFLDRTYQFKKDPVDLTSKDNKEKVFKVLNYNVFGFWITQHHSREDDAETNKMKKWILKQNADVLCMPEFNNEENVPDFRTVQFLKKSGYPYSNMLDNKNMKDGTTFKTLAMFSKYPIIAHKEKSTEQQNGLMYIDIVVGKDTLRVIGVHLYSMSLRLSKLVNQKEMSGIKRETRGTLSQMKKGFIARVSETKILEKWIKESPYAVIVCGDFNETPYSYVYGKCRKLLNNAFETRGEGFGFSFNHLPYFIRIDNQFYNDKKLEAIDFKTLNKIKYSDHYPCLGTYRFKKVVE